jgi:biopolymer transport protein ExbB/TolQ
MLFAQATDLPSVPAEVLKWTIVVVLALFTIVAAVVLFVRSLNEKRVRIDDQPPLEVRKAAKRYNHEVNELRFAEIDRRLAAHARELENIQRERAETLKHINRRFERVLVSLASIAGKVGANMPRGEEEEG